VLTPRSVHRGGLHPPLAGAIVKLLDLGLARIEHLTEEQSSSTLAESGAVMGTPDYIAPEQAKHSKNVDIRAELYSLVMKRPEDRYQTPKELAEVLEAGLKTGKWPAYSPLSLVLGGEGPGVRGAIQANVPVPVPVRITPQPAAAPIAMPVPPGTPQSSQTIPQAIPVLGHRRRNRPGGVAVSPDGKLVASGGDDGLIRVWEIVSGRSLFTCKCAGVNSLAFSPDGTTLASSSRRGS
jgi:serine/threonine protein kinase